MSKHILDSKLARMLKVNAITIYPFIFFAMKEPSEDLIVHEEVHIRQQKKGLIKFYFNYVKEYLIGLKNGLNDYDAYMAISYEIEAYAEQNKFIKENRNIKG